MYRHFCTIHGLNHSHDTALCHELETLATVTARAIRAALAIPPKREMTEAQRQKKREKQRARRHRRRAEKMKEQKTPSGAEVTEPPPATDPLPQGLPLPTCLPYRTLVKVEDGVDTKFKL
ncbi:hypothetical protein N7509_012993 [Penicillium cosmopolitanum]|uniref:Uncharacterized protein n=1 Tax=Penicillium cosmopolitanum TaxID=1131564 RepID=A0A9W9VBQ3_9EURO|nr:uncharacterized protein N7509_012993 [Penicillium cosmopolitanum]KAJ5376107.1 hypothetical protein N7509_012993 [Penicillium cosmopolitanum]